MGEPARKTPREITSEPDDDGLDDELLDGDPSGTSVLQRWVERPDGRMELVELPLTPELFLNPQLEDTMIQGRLHGRLRHYLTDLLDRHLAPEADVMVLEDMKHLLGRKLPGPAPDVSVVRGARDPKPDLQSFNVARQGVSPCLVIEVISPRDVCIRQTDEVDKVDLYQRAGITEYLLVDPPRRGTGHRFRLKGYRLGPARRYQPIEPDAEGRLLSVTTQLLFGVTAQGDWIELYDARTGERLRSSLEEEESRKKAEEKASQAEKRASREKLARKSAEAELERLRAEIEKLKRH